MELRLRLDRPTHRHPRHPPNPYCDSLAIGAANRERASQIAGLIQVQPFGWFHPSDADIPTHAADPIVGCERG
jgi:hypothetical protein